ncbi:hypothetical protein H206_02491 [Candidatus Electrothrix aarhusensis]|jgi:hypothetical protein|uniref:Uncharacterized protein n=1 Tax=Candidatus Electrothrix aarhusensis TaxID=1859131 RepID=A0A3S3SIW0_9BACT|nr:hypothetical protein H206_02491 [Candidatus Electrothrix aarhusensis]
MLQFKRISINFALVVSLAAFVGVNSAQAEKINIPLPTGDLEIQAVVNNVRTGVDVKAIMRQTRDNMKVEQVKRLPLLPQMRNAVGNVVSTRVMEETRTTTMNTQMAAMQDPVNPDAIPTFIAPKFE